METTMNTQAFTRRWHKTPATTASSRSNGGGNGTGGTAADFRTAAASITETADALATLAVLLENVAVALDDDNASAALAKLQQLPVAYQHAARELSQVEERLHPLSDVLGQAINTATARLHSPTPTR
jgi:ABC-type phosphate transport system substrate-binding protein